MKYENDTMIDFKNAILPQVQYIEGSGKDIQIGVLSKGNFKLELNGCGNVFESAVERIKKALSEHMLDSDTDGEYPIMLKVDSNDIRFGDKGQSEAYVIDITDNECLIIGYDDAGAFYGAVSFSQLLHTKGDGIFISECKIVDYPEFATRGHFVESRYGSDFMTLEDWKKAVDYFADQKLNALEIALYGCWVRQYDGEFAEYQYIPFKKYPELKSPRYIKYYSAREGKWKYKKDVLPIIYEQDYLGELIAYAKKKNITVFPLFNSLGHNTLIPRLYPETSTKDEDNTPNGASFCTRNEKTLEIILGIYDEILDKYIIPNGIDRFAIGLDEVGDVPGIDKNNLDKMASAKCMCEKCRDTDQVTLLLDYTIKLVRHLKNRGMKKVYVYYDMFCLSHDLLNDELAEIFIKEEIDDVICFDWWDYRDKDTVFKTTNLKYDHLFNKISKPMVGYYSWAYYFETSENIVAVKDFALERKHEGLLSYSTFDYGYDNLYALFSECAWNPKNVKENNFSRRYSGHTFPNVAQGAAKMLDKAYKYWQSACENPKNFIHGLGYYSACYHTPCTEYPQNFPANSFKHIEEKHDEIIPYLEECVKVMREVYDWFGENTSSWQGDVIRHNALNYAVWCDYFLTLYNCQKEYNKDGNEEVFIREIERLIFEIDKLISFTEYVRIEANQYTFIRNISVLRQSLCDLREYFKREIEAGGKPEIDIFNFGKYLSDVSWFLR